MADNVYKHIQVTGTSTQGQDEAIRIAVQRASKTVRNMRWFEVVESRGQINEGNVVQWQVTAVGANACLLDVQVRVTWNEEGVSGLKAVTLATRRYNWGGPSC